MLKRILYLGLKQTVCRHFQILNKKEFLAVSHLKTKSCETAIMKKNEHWDLFYSSHWSLASYWEVYFDRKLGWTANNHNWKTGTSINHWHAYLCTIIQSEWWCLIVPLNAKACGCMSLYYKLHVFIFLSRLDLATLVETQIKILCVTSITDFPSRFVMPVCADFISNN